jgi:hypothetical protein
VEQATNFEDYVETALNLDNNDRGYIAIATRTATISNSIVRHCREPRIIDAQGQVANCSLDLIKQRSETG